MHTILFRLICLSIILHSSSLFAASMAGGHRALCRLEDFEVSCTTHDESLHMRTLPDFVEPQSLVSSDETMCVLDKFGVHCWAWDDQVVTSFTTLSGAKELWASDKVVCGRNVQDDLNCFSLDSGEPLYIPLEAARSKNIALKSDTLFYTQGLKLAATPLTQEPDANESKGNSFFAAFIPNLPVSAFTDDVPVRAGEANGFYKLNELKALTYGGGRLCAVANFTLPASVFMAATEDVGIYDSSRKNYTSRSNASTKTITTTNRPTTADKLICADDAMLKKAEFVLVQQQLGEPSAGSGVGSNMRLIRGTLYHEFKAWDYIWTYVYPDVGPSLSLGKHLFFFEQDKANSSGYLFSRGWQVDGAPLKEPPSTVVRVSYGPDTEVDLSYLGEKVCYRFSHRGYRGAIRCASDNGAMSYPGIDNLDFSTATPNFALDNRASTLGILDLLARSAPKTKAKTIRPVIETVKSWPRVSPGNDSFEAHMRARLATLQKLESVLNSLTSTASKELLDKHYWPEIKNWTKRLL